MSKGVLIAVAGFALIAGTSAASGAPRFAFHRDVVWSPNGKQIAFVNGETRNDIFVMNLDGSGLRRITTDGLGKYGLAWTPNGKWIAYEVDSHLEEVSPDGAQHRRLTSRGGTQPDFSPSGQRVAYTDYAIQVMYQDGSEQTPVATPANNSIVFHAPTWSPNGRRIAFAVGDAGDAHDGITPYLAIINQNGGPETKLAIGHNIASTDWSPDGSKILFVEVWQISVLDLKTRKVRNLGQHAYYTARWSPSGRKILFNNEHGIFVMNSNGSHVHRLLPR
jgi:Tol biopolymer transport system component